MNPSSLGIGFSAVQRQKDMYKFYGSMLFDDEGSPNLIQNYLWGEATDHM